MAKTIVKNSEGMKTPFLRGILTSSLLDAGVEFDQAYDMASNIKELTNEKQQVTTSELRDIIISQLENNAEKEVIERFLSATNISSTIMVTGTESNPVPFSRGQLRLCIESCGISSSDAFSATTNIYNDLLNRGYSEISGNKLGRMTYQLLLSEMGEKIAKRYLVWSDFLHSGRPLLLLIGGTAGVGKSTIATEVGHRFGIVRTQSTDMLREVMRMMTPQRLSPVLHASSYNAWKVQPDVGPDQQMTEQLLVAGYLRQAELLSVACEAIINRAMQEKVSLILEGVHIHPTLIEKIPRDDSVIIAPIMLSVLKANKLKQHIKGRGKEVPERRAKRYLEHFTEIWELQSFLMAEADRHHVPIVSNIDRGKAIQEVMKTINNIFSPHFSHDLDKVFPV
jgi:2-phosphoglycerate kinase